MTDFPTGYRMGYQDALADMARRGIISMSAAQMVPSGPSGMSMAIDEAVKTARAAPKRARRRKDPKLSKAFKEANRRLRTKSGKLRKGKTQADVARLAQRLRKKM